jgi:hypothetical protein
LVGDVASAPTCSVSLIADGSPVAAAAPSGSQPPARDVTRKFFSSVRREDIFLSLGCVALIIGSIIVVTYMSLQFVVTARELTEWLDIANRRNNYTTLTFLSASRYMLTAIDLQASPTDAELTSSLAEYRAKLLSVVTTLEEAHEEVLAYLPYLDEDQYELHYGEFCRRQVFVSCPTDYPDWLEYGFDRALRMYIQSAYDILDTDPNDLALDMTAYEFIKYADLRDLAPRVYETPTYLVNWITSHVTEGLVTFKYSSLVVGAVVIVALGMVMPFILRVSRQEAQIDTMVSMIGILELSQRHRKREELLGAPGILSPEQHTPAPHDDVWGDINILEAERAYRRPSVSFM